MITFLWPTKEIPTKQKKVDLEENLKITSKFIKFMVHKNKANIDQFLNIDQSVMIINKPISFSWIPSTFGHDWQLLDEEAKTLLSTVFMIRGIDLGCGFESWYHQKRRWKYELIAKRNHKTKKLNSTYAQTSPKK